MRSPFHKNIAAGNFARSKKTERVKVLYALFARVAQSAEHFLGKEVVTGSIPVVGSINNKNGGPLWLRKSLKETNHM